MKSYNQSRLSMSVTKAVMTFKDLFLNPICINACLHYSYGKLLHRNWGDDINVIILFSATTILSAVFQPIK